MSPFDGDPLLLVISWVGVAAFWWAWLVYVVWHWLHRQQMNTIDVWVRGSIGLVLLSVAYGLTAFIAGLDPSFRVPPLVAGGMGTAAGMSRLLLNDLLVLRRRRRAARGNLPYTDWGGTMDADTQHRRDHDG